MNHRVIIALTISLGIKSEFKLGLENISDKLSIYLRGKSKPLNIGLITNQSGTSSNGERNIDYLLKRGYSISTIFVPEHGLEGKGGSGKKVNDAADKKTGIPIISLYTGDCTPRKFTKTALKKVDVFVFDIQDSGMRHFTYVSSMLKMMEVAAEFNKKFVVFDRPNPLGYIMEGPLVDAGLKSFIAIESFPIRHGLTLGELALYFNKYSLKKPIQLLVSPLKDYDRRLGLAGKLERFISPGLRSLDSCFGYSFLGLLGEIRPFAVGLKSGKPFQCIMLHVKNKQDELFWSNLKILLKKFNIEAETHSYRVGSHQYKGLLLKFEDMNTVEAFSAFLSVIFYFQDNGIKLTFSKAFDTAAGTKDLKKLVHGTVSKQVFLQKLNTDLNNFLEKIRPFLLYEPYPKVITINIE